MDVSQFDTATLTAIVQALDPRWRLFGQIIFSTGSRPIDVFNLSTDWCMIDKNILHVEWRLTKNLKSRGKRRAIAYDLIYTAEWPAELIVELRNQHSDFHSLGSRNTIAANFNAALKQTARKLSSATPTSTAFRDHLEQALRKAKVPANEIARMMLHSEDMGEAHYVPLIKQGNKASKK